jgi:hypothetical protein
MATACSMQASQSLTFGQSLNCQQVPVEKPLNGCAPEANSVPGLS